MVQSTTNAFTEIYSVMNKLHVFSIPWMRALFVHTYFLYKRQLEDPLAALLNREPYLLGAGHVLDVGANIGYTSVVFEKHLSSEYNVFAFEPGRTNMEWFREVITVRKIQDRVKPFEFAVGEKDGVIELWNNPNHHADHRVVTHALETTLGNHALKTPVKLVSLDSFTNEFCPDEPVSFIKIDVQGYEIPVFKGMCEVLDSNPDVVVSFEYDPASMESLGFKSQDALSFFTERGFTLWILTQQGSRVPFSSQSLKIAVDPRGYTDILATKQVLAA